MFIRLALFVALLVLVIIPSRSFARLAEDKSCRDHPKLVGSCFNVHGRLSVYNGAPALRIWRIGTKRILGVSDQRFALEGYSNIPEGIRSRVDQDNSLTGDFRVCPFTKQRPNEMQLVCIESGTKLVGKKR